MPTHTTCPTFSHDPRPHRNSTATVSMEDDGSKPVAAACQEAVAADKQG